MDGVATAQTFLWQADHHMHLASPDLCKRVGECLDSHHPSAVLASDAIGALDEAKVFKGVILSCAYLYGLPSLKLSPPEVAELTRKENEFTAAEVSKYPARLVGFMSVNPLADSALEEIRHWAGSRILIGLKLHFTASAVHIRNAAERGKVAAVLKEAAAAHLPVVIHIGGGDFDGHDADLFIREVLPSAGESWVQVAHAGGGLPMKHGNQLRVLRSFAAHITSGDPATQHVFFDLSYVPAPGESPRTRSALALQMRKIGMARFLFGSDFNVLTPRQEMAGLARLPLSNEELQTVKSNCAPWVCARSGLKESDATVR
jgi:uncharacterized protein